MPYFTLGAGPGQVRDVEQTKPDLGNVGLSAIDHCLAPSVDTCGVA
jgi:hypothetical protein